jgi:hypothetical protein
MISGTATAELRTFPLAANRIMQSFIFRLNPDLFVREVLEALWILIGTKISCTGLSSASSLI